METLSEFIGQQFSALVLYIVKIASEYIFNTALQKISNKQQKSEMLQHLPLQIEGFKGSENVETGSGCVVEPEPQGAENFGLEPEP
jgi:hypothetical protein